MSVQNGPDCRGFHHKVIFFYRQISENDRVANLQDRKLYSHVTLKMKQEFVDG